MHLGTYTLALALTCSSLAACAMDDNEGEQTSEVSTLGPPSFTLTIASNEGGNNVLSSAPTNSCPGSATCFFPYLGGTALTIKPIALTDKINCVRWHHWTGACAGQGSTCSVTINSNISTAAVWTTIIGCDPA